MSKTLFSAKLGMVGLAGTALVLSACESAGSYRIASVGTPEAVNSGSSGGDGGASSGGTSSGGGASSSGGGTSSSGGSGGSGVTPSGGSVPLGGPVLVTAGNTVIGLAGKHDQLAALVDGKVPAATPVTGTVTAVLTKSGQTLVDLGSGQSVILNKAGGKLGELVTVDLGSKTVVGAAPGSSLLGVGVASPTPATGTLAAVNVGNGGSLAAIGGQPALGAATTAVHGAVAGATATTTNVLSGAATTPAVGLVGGAAATGGLGITAGPAKTGAGGGVGGLLAIGKK